MKSILRVVMAVLVLASLAAAEDLPEAPSAVAGLEHSFVVKAAVPTSVLPVKEKVTVVDKKFVTLAVISTASAFADSFTTLWATENWRAGKTGVCNAEVESAYLYGTHPTAGRAYTVAAVKSAGSILGSYYLRKHRHGKLWTLPMLANTMISLQGVTQNMRACN